MELSVYLGRLPIMDLEGKIFAYELLHRCSGENHTLVDNNIQATARVLVNALNYIGLESLTAYKPALIKVDDKALFDDLIFCISPEYFILEILEESIISPELIERLKFLHQKGYTFALNHYRSDQNFTQSFKEVIPFASYIKIDIRRDTKEKVIEMLAQLKHIQTKCIAEKVEDLEEYEWAKEVGFDYFEGYYFSKPQIYIKELIDPDSKTLLNLIYLLKKDASIEKIIHVINESPYLSINMLKFIHLHHKSANESISSIEQALVLLGRQKLSYWVELMIYAQGDDEYDDDNIASPLGKIARSRAILMEELAPLISPTLSNSAYLVGILSLAEAIFQSSFKTLFTQMSLDADISKALESKEGILGELLKLCMAVESNHFDEIEGTLRKLRISQKQLNSAMMSAYKRSSLV